MIITMPKKIGDVIKALRGSNKVFLMGCSECASLCGTGDDKAVDTIKAELDAAGIIVTGSFIPKTGCQVLGTRRELKPYKAELDDADAILVMSCGAGVQSVTELFEDKPVIISNDTKFLGNMTRFRQFDERCSMCGECIVNNTGGICPVTRCPKGLLNGPCGGVSNGMCEVYPDAECIWVKIYERMEKLGLLEELEEFQQPKDYSDKIKHLKI